ncbi:MAG: hypothetical protein WAK95_13180 [Desulfobacterales bacterium]
MPETYRPLPAASRPKWAGGDLKVWKVDNLCKEHEDESRSTISPGVDAYIYGYFIVIFDMIRRQQTNVAVPDAPDGKVFLTFSFARQLDRVTGGIEPRYPLKKR